MRAVFIGASALAVATARVLLQRGHEVVIVERDKDTAQGLAEELDCGFIHGDGSKPAILREADPQHTDVLYCLTDRDQANIIASLVARSLGFKRVITKIEDPDLEHICIELGLEHTIIPTHTIGGYLADIFEGRDPLELSVMVRGELRAFSFVARAEDEGPLEALGLPERTRVVCLYRDEGFILPDAHTQVKAEDEVVLVTHRDNLETLARRLRPGGPGA